MQRFLYLKGWVGFFPPLLPVWERVLCRLLTISLLFFPGCPPCASLSQAIQKADFSVGRRPP